MSISVLYVVSPSICPIAKNSMFAAQDASFGQDGYAMKTKDPRLLKDIIVVLVEHGFDVIHATELAAKIVEKYHANT